MKEVKKFSVKTVARSVVFNAAMLALYIFIFYIINALCNGIAVQIAVTRAFAQSNAQRPEPSTKKHLPQHATPWTAPAIADRDMEERQREGRFLQRFSSVIRYNDNGEWKDGSSFGRHDLLYLAEAAREAATKIRDRQQ